MTGKNVPNNQQAQKLKKIALGRATVQDSIVQYYVFLVAIESRGRSMRSKRIQPEEPSTGRRLFAVTSSVDGGP